MEKWMSLAGMFVLLLIAYLISENKKKIDWKLVVWGIGLQFGFALLILKTEPGKEVFRYFNDIIVGLLDMAQQGAGFVFGNLINNNIPIGEGMIGDAPISVKAGMVANPGAMFAFKVLPTIIFFSSFMAILYHLGIMQRIVSVVAKVMAYTMKTSGSESLSAAANIFVGQTEAPLVVKPYLDKMTRSELMAIMTGGMATVAGGVMAAYVAMLIDYFPSIAGHLMAASIMSAPAALIIAKIMIPETEESETRGKVKADLEKLDPNAIGAAARGASEGLQLALNVGGMLIGFIAIVALINQMFLLTGHGVSYLTGQDPYGFVILATEQKSPVKAGDQVLMDGSVPEKLQSKLTITQVKISADKQKVHLRFEKNSPYYQAGKAKVEFRIIGKDEKGIETLKVQGKEIELLGGFNWSLSELLGLLFAPLAFLMGVPWKDCRIIGFLFGEKIVLNEFVAYLDLAKYLQQGVDLSMRSKVIATYALCGFANLSSIAIQIGGIGAIAPSRKKDLAELGVRSMIAGAIAAFMTATIAGILV